MRDAIAHLLAARLYERPTFQVGASRSGTIVLYKALGTHPREFSMLSEDPFVNPAGHFQEDLQRADAEAWIPNTLLIEYWFREARREYA